MSKKDMFNTVTEYAYKRARDKNYGENRVKYNFSIFANRDTSLPTSTGYKDPTFQRVGLILRFYYA